MGELFDFAKQHATATRRANQQGTDRDLEMQRLARERTSEFVTLMRQHGVPQIPLCEEGEWVADRGQPLRRREERTGSRQLSVLMVGWIAIEKYRNDDYDDFGMFINEAAEAYLCTARRISHGVAYVARPKDRLERIHHFYLAGDHEAKGIARTLMNLGIV